MQFYRLVHVAKNDVNIAIYVSQMFQHIQCSSSVYIHVRSAHFQIAVGGCSFGSDTSKATHVTSLLQLMSSYRRNNSSSEPWSALVALDYEKPCSKEGGPAHTTSCGCKTVWWNLKETVLLQLLMSPVQASTAQSRWKATQVYGVCVGASREVEWLGGRSQLLNIHQNNRFGAKFKHSPSRRHFVLVTLSEKEDTTRCCNVPAAASMSMRQGNSLNGLSATWFWCTE